MFGVIRRMSSGIAAESLLSDLYLNGAKAPILVTNHRSNCVRIQPECSPLGQPSSSKQTNFIYGSSVNRFYPVRETDRNGSLPRVDSDSSVGKCHTTPKHLHKVTDDGDEDTAALPPPQQTSSLVAIGAGAGTSATKKQNFGSLDRESVYVGELSDDDRDCPADQQTGQCGAVQPDRTGTSSGSFSSKENISPHPPNELKKKKVKRRNKNIKTVKTKRHTSSRRTIQVTRNTHSKDSPGCHVPTTAPSSTPWSHRAVKVSCTPAVVYQYSHHKPSTAQSAPDFPQTCAQRHEVCRSVYIRQGQSMPYRTGTTLPIVSRGIVSRPSTDLSQALKVQSDVIQMRLSDHSTYTVGVEDTGNCQQEGSFVAQRWGRLIKIYLSERQSGSLRDAEGGNEYPCAPPATPTPDQLRRFSYVPCMNDIKAQRVVKCRLHALEKAEQKRTEKQRGKKAKVDQKILKDNEKVLKQRQRQEIYALNSVMTELEYNRFVAFCLSQDIQPN